MCAANLRPVLASLVLWTRLKIIGSRTETVLFSVLSPFFSYYYISFSFLGPSEWQTENRRKLQSIGMRLFAGDWGHWLDFGAWGSDMDRGDDSIDVGTQLLGFCSRQPHFCCCSNTKSSFYANFCVLELNEV